MIGLWVIFFILYVWTGRRLLAIIMRFQTDHRMLENNFAGERIPFAGGAFLWLMCLLFAVGTSILERIGGSLPFAAPVSLSFFALTVGIVFVAGLIDDAFGSAEVKGLHGHVRMWMKSGVITTGLVKAALTGGGALWTVVVYGNGWISGGIGFLLLTLTANAVNLLDVRPGRALKGSFLLIALLLMLGAGAKTAAYLFPLLAGMLWFLPEDLRGRAMLGDAGSNVIGFVIGFCALLALPLSVQAVMAALLVLMHLFTEKHSLSTIIEKKAAIRWLDRLGRPEP